MHFPNLNNPFILQLNCELLPSTLKSAFQEYKKGSKLYFSPVFAESLSGTMPKSIDEITPETFKFQVIRMIEAGCNRYDLSLLKTFYKALLLRYPESTVQFTNNGIDYNFLLLDNACHLIYDGYHLVRLSNRTIPLDFDRWCIVPDASAKNNECSDVLLMNRYKAITFEDIKSNELKTACKRWFYVSPMILNQKLLCLRIIKDFLKYRESMHQQVKSINVNQRLNDSMITYSDMIRYYNYTTGTEKKNRSNTIISLSSFFRYLKESKAYLIDDACFSYMPTRESNRNKNTIIHDIPAIPENDYKKIASVLQDRCNDSNNSTSSDKLTYVLFIMQSLTELRTSTILSLSIDDLMEYGKGSNQYYLMCNTKTTGGKKIAVGITPFMYNLLQRVITYTAQYREQAIDSNTKHKLFLSINGRIIQCNNINRHLKSACISAGLQTVYTLQNVRKTYMTTVARNAQQNGLSVIGIPQLFGHKSADTTLHFYTKFTEEEILMSVCAQSDITPPINTDQHNKETETTISSSCGHYQSIDELAECLICRYFIATPDYIPLFESYKQKIEDILHNKEIIISLGLGKIEEYQLILRYVSMYISALKEG